MAPPHRHIRNILLSHNALTSLGICSHIVHCQSIDTTQLQAHTLIGVFTHSHAHRSESWCGDRCSSRWRLCHRLKDVSGLTRTAVTNFGDVKVPQCQSPQNLLRKDHKMSATRPSDQRFERILKARVASNAFNVCWHYTMNPEDKIKYPGPQLDAPWTFLNTCACAKRTTAHSLSGTPNLQADLQQVRRPNFDKTRIEKLSHYPVL